MSQEGAVDRLYGESIAVLKSLAAEPSLQSAAGDNLRKALLLAAASHFEHRMTTLVVAFVDEATQGSALVFNMVKSKVIDQKYHTWFDWENLSANKFYSMFGQEFRVHMVALMKARVDLNNAAEAFLEIGNDRNRLVHQDYATFPLEKTLEEIYVRYKEALPFVDILPGELRACDVKFRRHEGEVGSAPAGPPMG
jgi:hypothetical protein